VSISLKENVRKKMCFFQKNYFNEMIFQKRNICTKISRICFPKVVYVQILKGYTQEFFVFKRNICTNIFQICTRVFQREYMYKNFPNMYKPFVFEKKRECIYKMCFFQKFPNMWN